MKQRNKANYIFKNIKYKTIELMNSIFSYALNKDLSYNFTDHKTEQLQFMNYENCRTEITMLRLRDRNLF